MKDNLQLIGQVILIILGPILMKHGVSVGNDQIDEILGSLSDFVGIVWKFWHWHATPSVPATAATGIAANKAAGSSQSGSVQLFMLLFISSVCAAMFALFVVGCAAVQKGQDPIVVNAERVLTVAGPGFDMVLGLDNANRDLWRQKAPAFHDFCEWLRQRQTALLADGTPTNVQRSIAMQLNLDKIKLDYKASKVSSNAVLEAIATLTSAEQQANAWLSVITNSPAPGQNDVAPIEQPAPYILFTNQPAVLVVPPGVTFEQLDNAINTK